jgi:hypothetical protein
MTNCMKVNRWDDAKYNICTVDKGTPDDLFISCISYEPRTSGILQKLHQDYKCCRGLFFVTEKFENYQKVQENKKIITIKVSETGYFDKVDYHTSSIENPLKIIIEIDKILRDSCVAKGKLRITLDATTFPRGELFTLLYYLRHLSFLDSLRILYVSPQSYGDWLSEGYTYPIVPTFFEGPRNLEKRRALLLLTGFEYDRAVGLIDDFEPSAVIIGKPKPGTSDKFLDTSEMLVEKLKKTRKIESKIYEVPANDPFSCKKCLEKIMREHSQTYDFLVSALGTKLEAIGTYLAYEQAQKFRVVYPLPLIYNVVNYSSGCLDVYEILLNPSSLT